MIRRLMMLTSGPMRYAMAGVMVMAALTLAVTPFSRSLVEQWARLDVESRSRLVYRSLERPIVRALADGDMARLTSNLEAVTQDERILALGLCDRAGMLTGATRQMPPSFSCQQAAR